MKRSIKRPSAGVGFEPGMLRLRVGWRNESATGAQAIPGVLEVVVTRVLDVFSAATV